MSKSKRHGVKGRRWSRKDKPSVKPVDPSGKLTLINPDVGTKHGNRYASARCGCCNETIEVRIDNYNAGKASCPTRRKQAQRDYKMRETHIKMIKLVTLLHEGKKLNAPATAAAIKYAKKLTADPALQEFVRREFKQDLADRDIRRAAQVAKHGGTPVRAIPGVDTNGKPIDRAVTASTKPVAKPVANVPVIPKQQEEPGQGWEAAYPDAWYDATAEYYREFGCLPPEDVDLRAYYHGQNKGDPPSSQS